MHRRCRLPHPRRITLSVANTQPGRRKCTTVRAMPLETSMAHPVCRNSSSLQPLASSSLQDSRQKAVSQVSNKPHSRHTTRLNRSPSTSMLLGLVRNRRIIHLMRQSIISRISSGKWEWGQGRNISRLPIYLRRHRTLVSCFALLPRSGCHRMRASRHRRTQIQIRRTSGAP